MSKRRDESKRKMVLHLGKTIRKKESRKHDKIKRFIACDDLSWERKIWKQKE